ncbi:PREDICTED: receptor-like protein kinase HAIKU2 [Theobroma cacao]|uniref:non-specific serine/threonine protein kinase n=1 Tax=Theobroma cacao TaxID=3641 RepID=A0AB32WT39_THECC|nr:PREDICTED: receptor-like protein kinase HAIKU2 [Theobroma cacao]
MSIIHLPNSDFLDTRDPHLCHIAIRPLNNPRMATHPLLLSLFWVLFSTLFPPSLSLTVETQALLDFKNKLKDPLNVLDSWKESESPCRFFGVSCDPVSGKVTEISLGNKSLSGEVSPSISVLHSLTKLYLPQNAISGKIPAQLNECTNLIVLNLTWNKMVGIIPDLSGLKKLEFLDLTFNFFSGKFPSWVGNLTELRSLGLADNNYDEGEIPETIGNLKNLTWLFLAMSNLRGQIPASIFELKALQTLDISRNKISGDFPQSISKLKNLTKIELFMNNLTGELPPGIADLTLLQEIDISGNQMQGTLPEGIGNLKNLVVFQCYNNKYSGEIPAGFGDMRHLIGFSIYRNNFSGEFPANFGRFSPLDSFDISENQFTGDFPRFLCESRKLRLLLALENNFSGEFPDTYVDCKSLERFRINKNGLSGKIPDGLWALPYVRMIDFGDNDFTGGISPSIGFSISLNQLVLRNNRFSSNLPSELGKLTNLERLLLNNNNFSGNLPAEIGSLKLLSSLYLEQNRLTGSIPEELGDCVRLVYLNLADNDLSGNIPQTVALMSSLNSLNLSGNKLSGSIPKNLEKLKLSSIDLSANQLSGSVPYDLLTIGGDKAFLGNRELCIDQNVKSFRNDTVLNVCKEKQGQKRVLRGKLVFFITIAVALLLVLAGLLLVSYKNFKLSEADTENSLEGEKGVDPKWKLASFHQMDIDADEICNLDEENLIGSGSTGRVYRLDLKKKGAVVAVKRLWKGDGLNVLAAEMEILGKIRHRNILKLYACLMKAGSSFLVFEYMANGNVFQALRREKKGGQPELDWYQRYKIALGAAKGISYLHHDCSPPIIHRDIKSGNILLDEDYEPKIADFGVAKIAEKSPKGSEYSCFAGTHGYFAPELAYTPKVTEKSDVYSFGVVLLELVTGRGPVEEEYGEGKDIVYWVLTHLNNLESVLKVLDNEVASETVRDDMIKVLKVGILCTAKLPSSRPTMREVVKMLIDAEPCTFMSPDTQPDKIVKGFL